MNKQEAIQWCKTSISNWPRYVHDYPSPTGWNWVIKQKPYCIPEVILQTEIDGEIINITKDDVNK